MQDAIDWLFSSTGFMPHGHCYLWQPLTLWLNVGSDGLIAAAYYVIPFALYHLVGRRSSEIPYPRLFLMFAAFIFLCGTTHLMEIWTVWHPDYRIAGLLKALTGMVSVATTVSLFHVMPQAMLLRGPRQLQAEVEARTAELARVNDELRAQIAARDLAENQLRDRDRRKDEFLATLAHELRNPLAPIRHAVKLLNTEGVSAERQRWGREVIDRQAHRMALLLDDLLDVSRITQGRLTLKKERSELAAIIRSAVDTVRPAVEEKGHSLIVTQSEQALEVEADPLRLSEAVSNLLTNAAKYTPRGGQVNLAVTTTATELLIVVSDTGVGFEPATVPELFEMFSRTHSGLPESESGLGIGLSLVKGLVQLHGGEVHAESRGKGLGSSFTIALPLGIIVAGLCEQRPNDQSPSRGKLSGKILIADDNEDAADSLGMLLVLAGHQVVVTHSGRQALTAGRQHGPDVVILDIGMPDMNGYEVARTLRNEEWGKDAMLIALTGWGQPDDKLKAQAAGFDRHLTKPIDTDVLTNLLGEALLSNQQRRG